MKSVAVIVHTGKTFGGGLDELRQRLSEEQIKNLYWYEVPKSRKAPKKVAKALAKKPDLILVWGGDGMVQRCLDAAVGSDVPIAVLPAGTANLFATNLGLPTDVPGAVDVAFRGRHRQVDLGRMNGEHFAVMAGVGFDAEMIDRADGTAKSRLGRLAYIWSGLRGLAGSAVRVRVKVDGNEWFTGEASCVLIGNVPKVFGGVSVFDHAQPDDGCLDVGVAAATGPLALGHSLLRVATGDSKEAPHVLLVQGRRITIRSERPLRYEMDGGSRGKTRRIKVRVVPAAVSICVPVPGPVSEVAAA